MTGRRCDAPRRDTRATDRDPIVVRFSEAPRRRSQSATARKIRHG
jgi:hypothetical protein